MEKKQYTNGDITVVWQPGLCMHSGNCVRGLGAVFNRNSRPWVNMQGADTNAIINQVNKCPSGALSFFYNDDEDTKK